MTRLHLETLETRENPVGPLVVDPTNATAVIVQPAVTDPTVPAQTPIDVIIANTLVAIGQTW